MDLYIERLNHAFECYSNYTFQKNIIMKYHYKAPTTYLMIINNIVTQLYSIKTYKIINV